MTEKSLHQIMNEIVGRIDSLQPGEEFASLKPESAKIKPKGKAYKDPLSELEAFAKLDDLLAHLQKQYLDAKAERQQAVEEHGPDSAMAEMAMDLQDSAWCALQTRHVELRQVRDMMDKAQRLMRESREEAENARAKDKQKEFSNFIALAKAQEQIREKDQQGGFEWAILLLLFNLVPMPTRQQFYTPQNMPRNNSLAA